MTDRTDLDPVRISLYQRRPVPRSGSIIVLCPEGLLQAASPNPVPLPRQPFPRPDSSRWFGAKDEGGKICAAGESFTNRVAVFAWIAKPRFNPGSNPGVRLAKRRQTTSHRIDQFLADPSTDSTGARKPFGGSVSHSRSGSGPRAVADLPPIPTHFSGLRLLSTDELDPQLLSHLTVCPSGSTERIVTGSFAGNPCV
jgi:hypothetical protein